MGFLLRHNFLLGLLALSLYILLIFEVDPASTACVSRPALNGSQTFVANTGCTKGSTYNTATARCHCWANCQVKKGYVCDSTLVPTGPTTATPSTAAPPTHSTKPTPTPTPAPTPTPTTVGPGTSKSYQIQARDLHNQYRTKHGTPALTLDSNLNALAEQCAVFYAQKGVIDHSCPYKAGAGENLIGGQGTWTQSEFATMGPTMWYDEVSLYNYANPGFSLATGHFTQVVWKSSTRLGYGVATVNGYTAGVGLYSPPGNIQGQFAQNVLPPTS